MPWQGHVADVALELLPDGTLAYDRVVLTVPRQSGKTTLLLSLITHRSVAQFPGGRLDIGPQKQTVVYTAQTRNDARKKWIKEFTPLLEASPFRRHFDKRLTNGSEGFDWRNGSTFDLVATMEKSGHGDTLDLGLIDEAFAQVDDRLEQAMEPATITRTSSQLWIVSTAGDTPDKSPFLWGEVEAGRRIAGSGAESTTAYFEWSCDPDTDDLDDPEVVASRHPAVGYTITVEDLRKKHAKACEKNELGGYRRAYCNVWGSDEEFKDPKIPIDKWLLTVKRPPKKNPGEITLVFDVDLDGQSASIGIGHGTISKPYGEVIEHRQGVGWLPKRMVELVQKWDPLAVGCNGAGPAGAQVGAVQMAFRAEGLTMEIDQFDARRYQQACGGLYTDVIEGRFSRPADGPLTLAGDDAAERTLGEGWVWDRRQATVPISPLVAVTIARALLPTEATVDAAANVW